MPAYEIENLPNGTCVLTDSGHRISTDALLLTAFCQPKPWWNACDLGTGSGILLLGLIDAGLKGRAVGVEQDARGAELLQKAAQLNKLDNIQVVCGDLCTYTSPQLFDLVVCNPPYFSAGYQPPNPNRAAARHEVTCTIEDVCAAAARILKDGGRFCVCYPADKLAVLIAAMSRHNLAPKRMQLARKKHEAPPWLVLLDARKAGGDGMSILPDYILPPGRTVRY